MSTQIVGMSNALFFAINMPSFRLGMFFNLEFIVIPALQEAQNFIAKEEI